MGDSASRGRFARACVVLLGVVSMGVQGCASQPRGQMLQRPDGAGAACAQAVRAPGRGTWVSYTVCTLDPSVPGPTPASGRSRRWSRGSRAHAGVMAAGKLMGFPGRARRSGATDPVDAIHDLLSKADPVAGVGDPRGAWRVLYALSLEALLETLDGLEERGLLDELLAYAQHNPQVIDRRVPLALMLRELVWVEPAQVSAGELAHLASELDRLDQQERIGAYRYLIARRVRSEEVAALLEGMVALEHGRIRWREPEAVLGMVGTGPLPAPVEPLPWDKPARQPGGLYLGNSAHRQIADHYRDVHGGETIFTNSTPIVTILKTLQRMGHHPALGALSRRERRRRPDIINLTQLHIYEIKPAPLAAEGQASVAMYLGILDKAGITVALGPSSDPGTHGHLPAPGGVFIFWSSAPGLIQYEYRPGRLVPVPVQASAGQKSSAPVDLDWRWELQPLTEAQQQALAASVVGTGLIILIMILLAPVGI